MCSRAQQELWCEHLHTCSVSSFPKHFNSSWDSTWGNNQVSKKPDHQPSLVVQLHFQGAFGWVPRKQKVFLKKQTNKKTTTKNTTKRRIKYWQHIITVTLQRHSTLNGSCLDLHKGNHYFNLNVALFNHFCVRGIWFNWFSFTRHIMMI